MEWQNELVAAIAGIVHRHGGRLTGSLVGDELRRVRPSLWRRWKSARQGFAGGLLRLCETHGGPLGLVLDADGTLRCDAAPAPPVGDEDAEGARQQVADDEAEASTRVRRAPRLGRGRARLHGRCGTTWRR